MTEPEDPYRPPSAPQQPQYGAPPPAGPPGSYPPAPPSYPAYGQAPAPTAPIASMGARFVGLIIDVIIVGVVTSAIAFPTGLYKNAGFSLLSLVLGCLYSGWLIGTQGQSVGHRALGIRVVDTATGGHIGFGRGALRWLVMEITGGICTLGYWSPFFNRDRRGWHDMASSAIAVKAR